MIKISDVAQWASHTSRGCVEIESSGSKFDNLCTLSGELKSGAAIAARLKKETGKKCHVGLRSGLLGSKSANTLHVLEDGLWTGIELTRTILALSGASTKASVMPLNNPEILFSRDIVFHFHSATDIAIQATRQTFREFGWDRMAIDTKNTQILNLLTDAGQRASFSVADIESYRLDNSWYESHAFIRLCAVGYEPADARKLIAALSRIGDLLYPYESDSGRLRSGSGFGTCNLGILHVFGHSIARAAPTVLWRGGLLQRENGLKPLVWIPPLPETGQEVSHISEL